MTHFAIVGCGRIARKHAALCAVFGTLAAVCDIVEEKANDLAEKYKTHSYYSVEELLKNESDLNVLVICTPNGLHPEQTILALEKGLHVICEKPMAIEVEDAKKMIAAAKRAGRELFIVKQNRFNEAVVLLKDLLNREALGKIFSIQLNAFWNRGEEYYKGSWHGDKKLDGGILFTQFSHFIDLMYWIFGDVGKVSAFSANFHPEFEKNFEDDIVTCFKMNNGAIGTAHFTINSFRENMEGSLTVFGEKGTVKIGGKYLNELSYQLVEGERIHTVKQSAEENDYGDYKGSMSNHDKVYKHITAVLAGREKNSFSGEDGLKTVEIIQKIYQAAE